jgi:DNA polymerase III subunit alpha, Gram-positive type
MQWENSLFAQITEQYQAKTKQNAHSVLYNSIAESEVQKANLWSETIFTFLDFETTGLNPTNDRIIEIGAIKGTFDPQTYAFQEIGRYQTLLNPGVPIPAKSTEVNKITNAMVANQPVFAQVFQDFMAFLDTTVLVAHNADFDMGFLKQAMAEHGVHSQYTYLCSLKLSRKTIQSSRYNLDVLAETLQIQTGQRHRAIDDLLITIEVFKHCIMGLKNKIAQTKTPQLTFQILSNWSR